MGRSVVAAILGVVLVAAALLGPPTVGATDGETALAQPEGFDRTVFEVTVHHNGSAIWTFEHHRVLDNSSREDDFRAFADRFESDETALYRNFVNRSEVLARTGTERTGREMIASDHARSASIDPLGQTEGVVRMSFEWSNFAAADDDGVVVADVFEGGLVLGSNQRVVFSTGDGVTFDSVQPTDYTPSGENLTRSDAVTYFGQREFADSRPRVEYVDAGAADNPMNESSGTNVAVFAVLVVLLLGVVTGLAVHAGLLDRRSPSTSTGSSDATPQVTPPEMRSDSDRVLDLLEDNGGRMKQVRIVEETDWSKSKVSMLLSDMEDDDQITKLRVGRENIVSLAGEEPDAAGSPFGDEQ